MFVPLKTESSSQVVLMLFADYETATLDTCDDIGVLFCSLFCCTIQNAQTQAKLDNRPCTICDAIATTIPLPCVAPTPVCIPFHNRQQLRNKYGFSSAVCYDMCTCLLCCMCMIMQDAREVNYREMKRNRKVQIPLPKVEDMDNLNDIE